MTFRKKTVGEGFSERQHWTLGSVETEADRRAAQELAKYWAGLQGTLRERAKRAAAELNGGELPPPGTKKQDDPAVSESEWYAREISDAADNMLDWLGMLNWSLGTKLTEDDVQDLFSAGYKLGRLTREAELKFDWESDALRGRKQAETLRDRQHVRNLRAQNEAKLAHSLWQRIADEIWTRNPKHSKTRVAEFIAEQVGASVNTIRQVIKKS